MIEFFCLVFETNSVDEKLIDLQTLGSSRSQIFFKIGALNKFAIFTGKHLCWSLFLIKKETLLKETPTQVFSCEYGEIFKISFFFRTPLVTASQQPAFCMILPHFAQYFRISLLYEKSWSFAAFVEFKAALRGSH